MVRVADYIFDFLARSGTSHVFMVPGGGAMHLVDAVGRNEQLRYIAVHHEQAASISAEAYSRIPGKLGCALVTTGPGVTNAITGVTGAWIDSVPMFVISGQVKRADRMKDSGVRQMGPQEVDTCSLVSGITKYRVTVEDPESIRFHLEKALHEATTGRPGPVWIDVPLDIQAADIDPVTLRGFTPETGVTGSFSDSLSKLADLIQASKKPLLLAGHGIRLAGAASTFRKLAEGLGFPVVATWNAMDLLPFDHPLFVGKPGSVAMRAPNFAIQNCDLLLCLGARLDNVVTAFNPDGFGRNAIRVQVDIDPAELGRLEAGMELSICADLADFIPAMTERLPRLPEAGEAALDSWRAQCRNWKAKYQVRDFGTDTKLSHYQFVDELSRAIPENTLITTGSSGLGIEVFYTAFRNRPGQRVFLTSGLGAMGYGLPAAIGACLANDAKPMVAIESDGSLQLNLQEFNTLRSLQLPIRLFVLNNAGYSSIRTTQRNYFDSHYVGTGPEAGLFLPELGKLCQVYDFPYRRIGKASEMTDVVREVLDMPGPVICEVLLQENEALRPKVSAIVQPDGSMISMPLEDMSPLLSLREMKEIMGENLSPESLQVDRDA